MTYYKYSTKDNLAETKIPVSSEVRQSYEVSSGNIYDELSAVNNDVGTLDERLLKIEKKDARVKNIIDNKNEYPEDLLKMLSRNVDMVDFVLNYNEKKGKSYSTRAEEVEAGVIPLFLQYDGRWGYASYGSDTLALTGCGPTALAMVLAGLTGDKSITPVRIAEYAMKNNYYVRGAGTKWSLMSNPPSIYGVKSNEIPLHKETIINHLNAHHPIICIMSKGDFTTTSHFIVLTGYENGKIKINDPNSKARSEVLWDYERIASQIQNLWAFRID